jgi:iron complex transport system substrate-binding protein
VREAGPAIVLDQLRAAGVQVETVQATHDWAEVMAKLRMAGRATGKQAEAEALAQQLQQQWQAVQADVARPAASRARCSSWRTAARPGGGQRHGSPCAADHGGRSMRCRHSKATVR